MAARAACLLAYPAQAFAGQATGWSYEGHLGQQSWGVLSPDFRACSQGEQQSPIDLANPIETELADIQLYWNAADWLVVNSGHGIELQGRDPGFALIDGARWELEGIHFHAPSEHTVNGVRFAMEAHFVHRNEAGDLAVIGVLIRGGGRNDSFDAIMADAPIHAGDEPGRLGPMSLAGLVTDIDDIMRYQGSLTTPPCSQNVMWTVLTDPLVVSDAAILAFTSLYPMNARDVQPLNRRFVLTD